MLKIFQTRTPANSEEVLDHEKVVNDDAWWRAKAKEIQGELLNAAVSPNRLRMALEICPDRDVFESLYYPAGDSGRTRGSPASVIRRYPAFTSHDVKILAAYWGMYRHRDKGLKLAKKEHPKPAKESTPDLFPGLSQADEERIANRVAEILIERLLK